VQIVPLQQSERRFIVIRLGLIGAILVASTQFAVAQTTNPGDNAVDMYLQAAKILGDDDAKNIMSPASSNATFPHFYPPLDDSWVQMEKQDYDLHAQVRQLVHEAGMMQSADWPAPGPVAQNRNRNGDLYKCLNECRNVANEIADAAEYQSLVLQNQPAAFESAGDLLRLSDLLKNQPGENLVRLLVADGITSLAMSRLMLVAANSQITIDPKDVNDLPLTTATQWIARLLDHPDALTERDQAFKGEPPGAAANPILQRSLARILETVRRAQTERDFVAMSLAAHVYQFEHGKWPANLEELKTELPRIPTDPWGDGKETLGYALIAGGLPDGADRPMIYSRSGMTDGLFYLTNIPEYSFYNPPSGLKNASGQRKQGGQFRDVTSWAPPEGTKPPATTRPLQ
jgi:hypothetical protein